MRHFLRGFLLLALLGSVGPAGAVSGVNPTGVNVSHTGVSSVFLTFFDLGQDERVSDGFWCDELLDPTSPIVTSVNPCRPGTILGFLPARSNLAGRSGTAGLSNLTDIMTIPASVSRRAFQTGLAGGDGTFFYVRRFIAANGSETYVRVTCRLAGGGARVPLALTDVRIRFKGDDGNQPVSFISRDAPLPSFAAEIRYNGSGRMKGRWEVVQPGDPEPSRADLLTEASLPAEQRGMQRRYTLIDRFDVNLPPTGSYTLAGPKPSQVPRNANGPYKILLRVEATNDREGNSSTGAGVVSSGGVAGFPMPTLIFYVGSPEETAALRRQLAGQALALMLPQADARIPADRPASFSWIDIGSAALYRLEINAAEKRVFAALVEPGAGSYTIPPWVRDKANEPLRWRVVALDDSGQAIAESKWRVFQLTK